MLKTQRRKNLVISAKSTDQSISWRSLWDFVDLIANQDSFTNIDIKYKSEYLLSPQLIQKKLKRLGYAFEQVDGIPRQINVSLIVCRSPDDLYIIKSLPQVRQNSDLVAAFILDSYFYEGYPRQALDYDVIFVSDEDDVQFVKQRYNCNVQYVWQGVDTVKWRSVNDLRSIDLVGFGRTPSRYHNVFQNEFHKHDSETFYLHSPIGHRDGLAVAKERAMFFKVLQNSSISLAFHLMFEPELQRPLSMMLTARWLESLVSGCLVLGKVPASRSAAGILSWNDATIEIEQDERVAVEQVREILLDRKKMKDQRELNVSKMIELHDWRARLLEIYKAVGLHHGDLV